jgi:UDP-glucose 4-epimerase
MRILVTGASGYIGSHTCLALLAAGHEVVGLDNFCNSSREALRRVGKIAGRQTEVLEADVRDSEKLAVIFRAGQFDAVIHLAGLKSVDESTREPDKYYDNNVTGTRRLVEAMQAARVKRIIFSSSAMVYSLQNAPPFKEDSPLGPPNPYGMTKHAAETHLAGLVSSDPEWAVVLLRYFNPAGAHESGAIGEDPNGVPSNLMPAIAQVAVGKLAELKIFGNDYATPDGTGIRDYLHVMDLAEGHVAALKILDAAMGRALPINLGMGKGYSVLEVMRAFEGASGKRIPHRIVGRRAGDVAVLLADPARAGQVLNWRTRRSLVDMCRDTWRWQQGNPAGYSKD